MTKLRSSRSEPKLPKPVLLRKIGFQGRLENVADFMNGSKALDGLDDEFSDLLADGFYFRPADTIPSSADSAKQVNTQDPLEKFCSRPQDFQENINVWTSLHSNPVCIVKSLLKRKNGHSPDKAVSGTQTHDTTSQGNELADCDYSDHFCYQGKAQVRSPTFGMYHGQLVGRVLI